jgi:hypothetical protein
MAAPSYDEVIQELDSFSLANATNHMNAVTRFSEFMDHIRPRIDEVIRSNPNLTAAQKRAFDEKEERIFSTLQTQFPNPNANPVPNQGGRRKSRRGKSRSKRSRRRQTRRTPKYKK